MSAWRRKALEALPEEKSVIEEASSPMALWIELHYIFEKLVNEGKESEVRKLLNYAAWCLSPKSGKLPNDTSTAVVCAFYEDIGKNKKMWPYFKEWFFPHEFAEI
jgi:hypothetical protein